MLVGRELSLVLIITGLAFLFEALRYSFGTLAFPEAGLVPFMEAVVFLGLALIDLGLSKPDRRPSPEPVQKSRKGTARDKRVDFILLTFGSFLVTYAVGLPAAIGVYASLSTAMLGLRSWWKRIAFGIALAFLVHYLFQVIFEIDLPSGFLPILFGE
jgi:Tripartite tricarboxylate transporter TctB family